MPASPIRKLVPFAEAAKKNGVHIYHLNIGQPDIETPSTFLDAVKQTDLHVLEYSHSAGNESLRKKVAASFTSRDVDVSFNDIMITTGGSEAIIFAMMTCLNPGDEVIIPEPFYANYNGFAQMSGVKVVPVTAQVETGFALPSIASFEEKVNENTKAIVICNPNNPTGYLYSKEELEALKAIVLKYDLFLFADEVYREFCYDGQEHTSILELDGLDQHAIVIDSVSKRFSACGARIGWMVSRNKEVMANALKFGQARLSPPTLEQIGAEAGLDTDASYFHAVINEYVSRRDVMVHSLKQIPGVVCPNPGGAFYVVVRLPIDDSDAFCQWMLESFSYEGATVMMAPATGFYASKGLGKNEVRIAYVLKKEDLQHAMICLEKGLQAYPGRTI
ncbi:MAG: pyridoxal phosphate-dependent aminotransferase [Proteobacteria bacterium]|nr:pyridoxal phosphate-dependent aminotransferase [Pseudomonadota bacterium]